MDLDDEEFHDLTYHVFDDSLVNEYEHDAHGASSRYIASADSSSPRHIASSRSLSSLSCDVLGSVVITALSLVAFALNGLS